MTPRSSDPIELVDPFDLPDWLGLGAVRWSAADGTTWSGCLVRGTLHAAGNDSEGAEAAAVLPCDLLAVDEAYPAPVAAEETRRQAHQAWQHGQVLLGRVDDRLRLVTPGRGFDPDTLLDALGRLARAVGAPPASFSVLLCAR